VGTALFRPWFSHEACEVRMRIQRVDKMVGEIKFLFAAGKVLATQSLQPQSKEWR